MKKRWTNRLPETGVFPPSPADGGTNEINDAQVHRGEVTLGTSLKIYLCISHFVIVDC